jgi:hypothetical protein
MTTVTEDKPITNYVLAYSQSQIPDETDIYSELYNRTYWLNAYTTSPVLLRELAVLSWLINATRERRLKEVCVTLIIN